MQGQTRRLIRRDIDRAGNALAVEADQLVDAAVQWPVPAWTRSTPAFAVLMRPAKDSTSRFCSRLTATLAIVHLASTPGGLRRFAPRSAGLYAPKLSQA